MIAFVSLIGTIAITDTQLNLFGKLHFLALIGVFPLVVEPNPQFVLTCLQFSLFGLVFFIFCGKKQQKEVICSYISCKFSNCIRL